MKIKHGASFFAGLREKQQQRKAQKQEQQTQMGMTPSSNGTGSGRPNFGEFAQQAIGSVMGGQKMSDTMGFRQGVNDRLDQVLNKLDPTQSNAGTPPADPMTPTDATAQANSQSEMLGAQFTGASASAKKIAKKQAKQYAAANNLSDKQAKSLKKEAKKNQSFDANKNEHADTKPGGDKNKTVNFGGSMNGGGRKKVSIDNKETATMKRKSFRRADGSAKLKQTNKNENSTIKTRKVEKKRSDGKGRRINKTQKWKDHETGDTEIRKTKVRGNTITITDKYRPKGSIKSSSNTKHRYQNSTRKL